MISRRIWMPFVAGVTAIAVGVGAFAIAAPFAVPRTVEPEMLDAWVLPTSTGLTPLAIDREGDEPPLDELLASTQVSTVDFAAPAAVRSAMLEAAAEVEALELADPDALLLSRDLIPSATRAAISADPCAAIPLIEGDCPDGGRATVLDLPLGPPLALRANYNDDCAPEPAARGRLEFQVFSTRPVVLDITYDVAGVEEAITLSTTDAAEEAWLAAGAVDFIAHCVVLTGLTVPWEDRTNITATDQTGGTAVLEHRLIWLDNSPVPPSWVEPLTNFGAAISIPTKDVSTVRFLAFAVPFGEPALACDFDNIENAIEPIDQAMQTYSQQQLRDNGYNDRYVERHLATFAVPEASTITFCAGWVDAHGWDGNIPDHVFGEVLHSPDLAYPVISIDDADLLDWTFAHPVSLEARFGGAFDDSSRWGESYCGSWNTERWGRIRPVDDVLCDATRFAMSPEVAWNNTLIVNTLDRGAPRTAAREYVHVIDARVCAVGCESIAPNYIDVPLPAQVECLGNGCAPYDRSWVRLRVDWVDGQDSWFTDWVRDDMPIPDVERPVLDRSSGIELGPAGADGLTFPATATIVTDREVTIVGTFAVDLSLPYYTRFLEVDVPVIRETTFSQRHVIDLGTLKAWMPYLLTLTLTDRDGNVSIYDGTGAQGLVWPAGRVWVQPAPVYVDADISVRRLDNGPVILGGHSVTIGSALWERDETGGEWFTCGPGEQSMPLEYEVRQVTLNWTFSVDVNIEAFAPSAVGADDSACPTTVPYVDRRRNTLRETVEIPIEQMRSGTTVTFERDGLEYTVHLEIVPQP